MAEHDLIVLENGSLDGQWFHRADWEQRRRAAERMGYTPDHPAGISLRYKATRRTREHRDPERWPAGQVWVLEGGKGATEARGSRG